MAGRLSVAISGLIGTIVATRYLGIDEFGELLTAITFVALFSLMTDVGIWTIAAREIARRPDQEREILTTVSFIGLVLSGVTILTIVGTMWLIYGGDGRDMVRLGIAITVVQLVLSGPFGTSTAFLTAHQRALPSAIGSVLAGLGFLAALALVIGFDLGFSGIVAIYALSAMINSAVPIVAVTRRVSLRPGWNGPLARTLIRAAIPQAFVLTITTLYIRIDTVLLSVLSSDRDVSLYGVSYRVLEFVLQVPGFAVITVFPELARASVHSERLRMLVQGLFSAVLLIAIPMLCVVVGFAPEIVRIVGGPEYDDASDVLRLLALAAAFSFPAVVFFNALIATDQQGRLARAMVVVLTGNVVLNVVLIGPLGARGAALSFVISEFVTLTLAWRLFSRIATAPRVQMPGRLLLAGTACAAVVVVVRLLMTEPAGHPVLVLAAGSLAALVTYAGVIVAIRALPDEVTSAIKQLRGA